MITTIDGNIDQIETGTTNKISVTSPERQHECNIPDMIRQTRHDKFKPRIMTTMDNKQTKTRNTSQATKIVAKNRTMEAKTTKTTTIRTKTPTTTTTR
jgi:hypothetical protein